MRQCIINHMNRGNLQSGLNRRFADWSGRISGTIALLSVLLGLLFLVSFSDLLEHAAAYIFLALLALIGGFSAITGCILIFLRRDSGRVLLRFFSIIVMVFSLYMSAIESDGFNAAWLAILLLWLLFFVLLGLNPIKSRTRIEKDVIVNSLKNGTYLRLNLPLLLFFIFGITSLTLIWTTD